MIKIYPVEIEAVDADFEDQLVFKLRTFDESGASLTVDTVISPGIIDEFCAALKQAVAMLKLEDSNHD